MYVAVPAARKAFAIALKSVNKKVVRQAIIVLAKQQIIPRSSIASLIKVFNGKNKELRNYAIKALMGVPLETFYVDRTIKAFVNKLEKIYHNDPNETLAILKATHHILQIYDRTLQDGEQIVRQIIPLYKYPDYLKDSLAITGYLLSSAKVAIPELKNLLNKNLDSNTHSDVLWVLGKIGPEAKKALPEIIAGTQNKSEVVRYYALWSLGEIGVSDPEVIIALKKAKAKPGRERWEAIVALASIDIAMVSDDQLYKAAFCEYKHLQKKSLELLRQHKKNIEPIASKLIQIVVEGTQADWTAYYAAKLVSENVSLQEVVKKKLQKIHVPEQIHYRDFNNYFTRVYLSIGSGCLNEAIRIGEATLNAYSQFEKDRALLKYNIACAYSLLIPGNDAKKEEYAIKAINYLKDSMVYGDIAWEHIERDKDLSFLLSHPDFKELIHSLKNQKEE
jgi:hypothetical protein